MAIIKCKMCGGDIMIAADKTFGTCEYCGSTMTLPKVDDDQRAAAFNRGNHFRRIGEFDKALAVYERIVAEDNTDAEAHWCCALCRFGIEYVEDPATYEYLPTCHRASFDSILEDVDYLAAVEYSDGITRRQYQKDAAKIAEVQRGILATSSKEEPFDVFICYKESDTEGNRTRDSLLAQEVYYQLTEQGYRVFFSRITLEDKVGAQYEPYIFAALNSAKVMVAIGTKEEHFNAVWVKNEWSRFLALMKKDRSKLLLPCYRDMDPYDMPEALSVLQSYDMGKIGFIQDLVRGIGKVLHTEPVQMVKETVVVQSQQTSSTNTAALLKRAFMFLEDGEWKNAGEYCEKVLDIDPECAEAYLGKLMINLRIKTREELKNCSEPFDGNNNYVKAVRFGDDALRDYLANIENRNQEAAYKAAVVKMNIASTEDEFEQAAVLFKAFGDYKESKKFLTECYERADAIRKEAVYSRAQKVMDCAKKAQEYEEAIILFESIKDYKDAALLAKTCFEQAEKENEAKRELRKKHGKIIATGWDHTVGLHSDGTVVAVGSNKYGQCNVSDWREIVSIAAAFAQTVGLRADGTVVATGNNSHGECNVSDWRDIVAIACGTSHTVGLCADGTVVATGYNRYGECNVSNWRDIVAIACGTSHTVGLRADGTVVAVGYNVDGQCNVSHWTDIVSIAVGGCTTGLRADGTVVAAGSNSHGQSNVSNWTKIISIAVGPYHTLGLRADGTVVAAGDNGFGQCNVLDWTEIISINTDGSHTVGLRADGTVVAVGHNGVRQCNVSAWRGIVSVVAGGTDTVGLRADGTVVAVGGNADGKCDVTGWNLYDRAEQMKGKSIISTMLNCERTGLLDEQTALQEELSTLKGLFSGSRRKQIEARLAEVSKRIAEIDAELVQIEQELAELS